MDWPHNYYRVVPAIYGMSGSIVTSSKYNPYYIRFPYGGTMLYILSRAVEGWIEVKKVLCR